MMSSHVLPICRQLLLFHNVFSISTEENMQYKGRSVKSYVFVTHTSFGRVSKNITGVRAYVDCNACATFVVLC